MLEEFVANNRESRNAILRLQFKKTSSEIENLKDVGRNDDALKRADAFYAECWEAWKAKPVDPFPINLMVQASLDLEHYENITSYLMHIVQDPSIESKMDLTSVYWNFSRIYDVRAEYIKRIWALSNAANCKSPQGCEFPATPTEKAYLCSLLYNFVYVLQEVLRDDPKFKQDPDEYTVYEERRRSLAPNIDWDDKNSEFKLTVELFRKSYTLVAL